MTEGLVPAKDYGIDDMTPNMAKSEYDISADRRGHWALSFCHSLIALVGSSVTLYRSWGVPWWKCPNTAHPQMVMLVAFSGRSLFLVDSNFVLSEVGYLVHHLVSLACFSVAHVWAVHQARVRSLVFAELGNIAFIAEHIFYVDGAWGKRGSRLVLCVRFAGWRNPGGAVGECAAARERVKPLRTGRRRLRVRAEPPDVHGQSRVRVQVPRARNGVANGLVVGAARQVKRRLRERRGGEAGEALRLRPPLFISLICHRFVSVLIYCDSDPVGDNFNRVFRASPLPTPPPPPPPLPGTTRAGHTRRGAGRRSSSPGEEGLRCRGGAASLGPLAAPLFALFRLHSYNTLNSSSLVC